MIQTERTKIEILSEKHAERVLDYYRSNEAHLSQWEPIRESSYLTLAYWQTQAKMSSQAFIEGREYKFIALTPDDSEIIGVCNFTGVVRRSFQACFLGYSVSGNFEKQGYMTEILQPCLDYMFEEVGLNRVMATYMPKNLASESVLKKLGFEREGYAKKYLKIAGEWEDHVLTSKLSE